MQLVSRAMLAENRNTRLLILLTLSDTQELQRLLWKMQIVNKLIIFGPDLTYQIIVNNNCTQLNF